MGGITTHERNVSGFDDKWKAKHKPKRDEDWFEKELDRLRKEYVEKLEKILFKQTRRKYDRNI